MKNFLVLYFCKTEDMDKHKNMSPEEKEQMMQGWFAWKDAIGDSLVDFGAPTKPGETVGGGECNCGDGSISLGGYSIVQAEDLAGAKALFDNHPMIQESPNMIKLFETMDPSQC